MPPQNVNAAPGDGAQVIQTRSDIVFFAGLDSDMESPEVKTYFAQAKAFFSKKHPTVRHHKAVDLYDILEALKNEPHGKVPWGDIYIVAHGTPSAWYVRLGVPGGPQVVEKRVRHLAQIREMQLKGELPTLIKNERPAAAPGASGPAPDPVPTIIDGTTRLILKSCELGKNARILFVIAGIFGYHARLRAPLFWLFFRTADGTTVERLFRHLETAAIPRSMTGPGQLSTDEKAMVLEALAKSPSSKGLSKTALETLVTTTTTGWKAGLSEWMVVTPFKFEGAISVNVATGGALSFLHDPGTDSDGFEVEPRTIPIGGVSDADMPGKHREVGAQIFRAMTRNEPYSDIKYWNAQFSCSPAIPASGTTPKHYDLSISIQGTLIRYFRMERDDKGNPTVPDVDNAAHYAQSTTKTRLTF